MLEGESALGADDRLRPASLLPPLLAGAFLRLWNLGGQVLGGDELHGVRAALGRTLGEVLTTHGIPDPFIPFAALTRLWVLAGGTVTDGWLRAPALAAGLAAIVVLPWLVRSWVGRPATIAFAWLLALSPGLVVYSRIARSYMPVVLLGGVAVLVFFRYWEGGRRRDAALYCGLGTAAVFCHLVAAPLVAAPLAYAARAVCFSRDAGQRRQRIRKWLLLCGALGLAVAVVLLPGRESLLRLIATGREPGSADLATARGVALLQTGTTDLAAASAFLGATLAGLVALLRVRPRFAAFTAWLLVAQVCGVLALSPESVGLPLIASRYLLPTQPLLLLWVAVAVGALVQRLATRFGRAAGTGLGAVLAVLWLAAGPLADPDRWRSSFAHHNDFVDWSCPRPAVEPGAAPALYRRLASSPRGEAVVELPWRPVWRFTRSLPAYQALHRRPVYVAAAEPLLADPRVRLARDLPALPEELLASPAGLAIVHRDLAAEEARLVVPACGRESGGVPHEVAARLGAEGAGLVRQLTESWGEPDFEDRDTVAWDLARVRAEKPPSGSLPTERNGRRRD